MSPDQNAPRGEAGAGVPSDGDFDDGVRSEKVAWLDTVYRNVARLYLDGRASERWVLEKVGEIVEDEVYSEASTTPPLGQLYDPEGDSPRNAEVVRRACQRQLDLPIT